MRRIYVIQYAIHFKGATYISTQVVSGVCNAFHAKTKLAEELKAQHKIEDEQIRMSRAIESNNPILQMLHDWDNPLHLFQKLIATCK